MKKIFSFCFLSLLPLFTLQSVQPTETTPKLEVESLKDQPAVAVSSKERVPTIKHTKKERLSEQKKRKAIAKKNKSLAHSSKEKCFSGLFTQYVQPLYRIKSVGANGRTLTFEDETIWEVSGSYASTARRFTPGSYVVIIPNTSWFSSYTYRLENVSDNRQSIAVNLSEGPFMKYASFITDIDQLTNRIRLTNGSIWTIQSNSIRNWSVGHAVLIGENRGWFGFRSGNILININLNTYLAANYMN